MTTPRDPDFRLRAYLDDGPTELPIRSYEAVDARIARTRQRVVIGPWRVLRMPNLSRIVSIAAAAMLLVLALALATGGPGGRPPASVVPASAPPLLTPAPTASPSPTPAVYRWPAPLPAGTYDTNLAWGDNLVFHFTVGDGWQAQDINIATDSYRAGLWFFPIANVASNACTRTMAEPPVQSVDEVLTALGGLVTFTRAPVDADIGGQTARYVEFVAQPPPPTACSTDEYKLFKLPPGNCPPAVCSGLGPDVMGLEFGAVPHHWRLWVMDIGRQPVAVAAIWQDNATAAELDDLQAVIDSFRLDTPFATQAPQPSSG
jgi:hypothetical protein